MIGETLSHYEIVGEVGYGGLGRLHRARDKSGGRDVALAVLSDSLRSDSQRYQRLVTEARTASTLEHRNIARLSAVESDAEREFVAIELVEGERLVDLMAAGPIPPDRALEIAKEVAEALALSHDKGLIHRDLKPANIILSKGGLTKIIDFGIHALQDPVKVSEALAPNRSTPPPGEPHGSAPFMSPEQAGGMPVDIRSDIFSFGGMLFAMLTGKPPFTGKDGIAVMSAVLQGPIPELPAESLGLNPECAAVLLRVLERSLSRDPARRYQSMREAGIFLPDAPDDPIRANLQADLRTARTSLRPSEESAGQDKSSGCLSRLTGAALALLLIALAGVRGFAAARDENVQHLPPVAVEGVSCCGDELFTPLVPKLPQLEDPIEPRVGPSTLIERDRRDVVAIGESKNGTSELLGRHRHESVGPDEDPRKQRLAPQVRQDHGLLR